MTIEEISALMDRLNRASLDMKPVDGPSQTCLQSAWCALYDLRARTSYLSLQAEQRTALL